MEETPLLFNATLAIPFVPKFVRTSAPGLSKTQVPAALGSKEKERAWRFGIRETE
jgi:hypothetical protein